MKAKRFLFTAVLFAAMAITFIACGSDDGDKGCSSTATHYCSNGTGNLKEYGYVSHGGQTYKTVEIGTQTWMAENLKGGQTFDGIEGWLTLNEAKAACPAGWHLPGDDEWVLLTNFAGGSMSGPGYFNDKETAKKLASKNDGGTDDYGFAAFEYGGWWSNGGKRYLLANVRGDGQIQLASWDYVAFARCVKDGGTQVSKCGGIEYEPSDKFCNGITIYDKCGGSEYNPASEFCYGSCELCVPNMIYAKCGGQEYSPIFKFCYGITIYEKCGNPGGEEYNPSTQFCACDKSLCLKNSVFNKCGGSEYNPYTQYCSGNTIYPK